MNGPLKYTLSVTTAALALTGCGQFLSTLPPIDIGDPLQLSDKEFTIGSGELEFQVPNLAADPRRSAPFGQTPKFISVAVPITRAALVGSCDADKVHEFDLKINSMSVHVSDTTGSADFTLPEPITLEFEREAGGVFKAKNNRPVLTFDQVDQALNVLTKGGVNTVRAEASVTTDNDDAVGCFVFLRTGTSNTLIKF